MGGRDRLDSSRRLYLDDNRVREIHVRFHREHCVVSRPGYEPPEYPQQSIMVTTILNGIVVGEQPFATESGADFYEKVIRLMFDNPETPCDVVVGADP
jgi:hypothetical protein